MKRGSVADVDVPPLRLLQQLAGDADQHAVGERGLEARLGELVEHLGDGQPVVLPEVVEQPQGVVLERGGRLFNSSSQCAEPCWGISPSDMNLSLIGGESNKHCLALFVLCALRC